MHLTVRISILYQIVVWLHCCNANTVKTVSSSVELEAAINNAYPGDTIILDATTFQGQFICNQQGTASSPITIRGSHRRVNEHTEIIGNGHGTAFTILGNHWNIESLVISGYDTGLLAKGRENRLNGLVISNVNKAIEIEADEAKVNGCVINSYKDYGIRVGANKVVLSGTTVQGGGYPSIIFENSAGFGTVSGNVANGGVLLKGSDHSFKGNVIQGHMEVSGCRNSFSGQVSSSPVFTNACPNRDAGGNVFY